MSDERDETLAEIERLEKELGQAEEALQKQLVYENVIFVWIMGIPMAILAPIVTLSSDNEFLSALFWIVVIINIPLGYIYHQANIKLQYKIQRDRATLGELDFRKLPDHFILSAINRIDTKLAKAKRTLAEIQKKHDVWKALMWITLCIAMIGFLLIFSGLEVISRLTTTLYLVTLMFWSAQRQSKLFIERDIHQLELTLRSIMRQDLYNNNQGG